MSNKMTGIRLLYDFNVPVNIDHILCRVVKNLMSNSKADEEILLNPHMKLYHQMQSVPAGTFVVKQHG